MNPAEFTFHVPMEILRTARARKRLIREWASTFAFRIVVIRSTLAIDPALGSFVLKLNNNSSEGGLFLKMCHDGNCGRFAEIRESPDGAIKVHVEGDCICSKSTLEVVKEKIEYVLKWQGTSKHLPKELHDVLKQVGKRINSHNLPVASAEDQAIMEKFLTRDTTTKMLQKYKVRGLLGGSSDEDEPNQQVEVEVTETETTTTGTKVTHEIGLEGWLFEIIGISKFFHKLSYEGPTTTVKTKSKKKFRAN